MSAGGLSYDCLTTTRKVTLPSVEMWGTNMNILANPNTGIFTRRIDKVGDTQGILLAQEGSGDRISEAINVYARGVNPMVSVSYDNYGNNAGSRTSVLQGAPGVKLPLRPQVFRPPVFRQEDLMPLSRQPREWFYALTNPVVPNIISQMSCPEGRSSVHKTMLMTGAEQVTPNLEYHLGGTDRQSSIPKGMGINKNVKNPQRLFETSKISNKGQVDGSHVGRNPKNLTERRQYSTESGRTMPSVANPRDMIHTQKDRAVHDNKLMYNAFSNLSGNKNIATFRDKITAAQEKAILDTSHKMNHEVTTNVSNLGSDFDMEGVQQQLAKAVASKNYAIEVGTQPKPQYRKEVEMGNNTTRAIHDDYLTIPAQTPLSNPYSREQPRMHQNVPGSAVHETTYSIPVSSTVSHPHSRSTSEYKKPGAGLHENILHVESQTIPTSSYRFDSENKEGYTAVRVVDQPLHTGIIDNSSFGYTREGPTHEHFSMVGVHKEDKMGSWVVASEARPFMSKSTEMTMMPHQASAQRLMTDAYTTPTSTQVWRTAVEPRMPTTSTVREEVRHIEGRSGRTSLYTKNVDVGNRAMGRVEDKVTSHIEYEPRKVGPVTRNVPGLSAQNIPVRTRDVQAISVVSPVGNSDRKRGLEGYSSSKQRTAIDNLYTTHSGNTNPRYMDRMGELGVKTDNPRNMPLIERETVHDRKSFGHRFYEEVQSRDGSGLVNAQSSSSGSFDALGTSVPRFDRMHENNGEGQAITEKFMDVKKKAVGAYMDRFQGDSFRQ
jgi:hypothetical protein